MNTFHKVPASKASLSQRKLVSGIGVNDAWYITKPTIQGVRVVCPIFKKWQGMIRRCYASEWQEKHKAYNGCTVEKEWHTFSNFDNWCGENYIEGYELDKDIKIKGNRVYGPDTCLFVPQLINKLFTNTKVKENIYPTGVHHHKQNGKYLAQLCVDGKQKRLGQFTTPELARAVYVVAKNEEIMRKCRQYPELKEYLLAHLEK